MLFYFIKNVMETLTHVYLLLCCIHSCCLQLFFRKLRQLFYMIFTYCNYQIYISHFNDLYVTVGGYT